MTDVVPETVSPFPLREGNHVQIHSPGYPPYHGLVEDSVPGLDVVWIRDLATGEREPLRL